MALEEIREARKKKISQILQSGEVYPSRTSRSHKINEILDNFDSFAYSGKEVTLVGRLLLFREHGGLTFGKIRDSTGEIQIALRRDSLGDQYSRALEWLDLGDILEFSGKLFLTKKGERTLEVKIFKMLAKTLRPLPEKWHGLHDVEERERKRYLDLLMNPDARQYAFKRSEIVANLRKKLESEEFLEVETPILQPLPGGARARPFTTHHNALDVDFYLRVSPELYLKRLLVAGFEKIFEIGRNFRNEGMDHDHNPEFTMLELYWAYQDYLGLMKFVEDFLRDFLPGPWETVTFTEILKKVAGKDYRELDPDELDQVFKKEVRPKIIKPTYVIDYPESVMPLAKLKKDNIELTESFQLIVKGSEIVKGFSELNDPLVQRKQMEEQEKAFRSGNEESSRMDEDFIEALEYGMPPAAGLGLGIDRLVMLLTGAPSLKEIILFPTLRPKK